MGEGLEYSMRSVLMIGSLVILWEFCSTLVCWLLFSYFKYIKFKLHKFEDEVPRPCNIMFWKLLLRNQSNPCFFLFFFFFFSWQMTRVYKLAIQDFCSSLCTIGIVVQWTCFFCFSFSKMNTFSFGGKAVSIAAL